MLPDGTVSLLPKQGQAGPKSQYLALDEVDRVLISSELVADSVSMVLRNPITNQQQLAATWVPSEQVKVSNAGKLDSITKNLLEDLDKQLPSSLVPALLIPVDEIPMNESYKIDHARIRREIEHMDIEKLKSFSFEVGADDHDDLTDVEKTIAGALSTVTGVDPQNIRKHTSFYKLGLDSLSAISFSRQLQDSGLGRLAVSTILRHSSVAQLATAVPPLTNGHQTEPPASQEKPKADLGEAFLEVKSELQAENKSVQGVYPCTPLQEAMLAAESDVTSAYFNHLLLRVSANIEALKTAWTQMQQRHDILRTCFRPTNDKQFAYAQVVLDTASLPWSCVESTLGLDQAVEERKSDFEGRSPVDGKLPYSLTIFTDSRIHETHLLLSIHHALYDGEGISQLLHEVQLVLAGQQLPEVVPFHRFIEYMVSASSDTSDKFWDRYISGISPSLLSVAENPTSTTQSASHQIHANLQGSLTSFKKQCKELSVTPLNVLHAAWARLLALHSNASDVCFGNVFSCRTIPLEGADRIVGPCFNTLPMRVKLSATSTNADVLKLSQKHNSEILPHQLSPLRRIQRRTLNGGTQLFDTLVILQSSDTELDSSYWELLQDEGNMGFPLICEAVPDEAHDALRICFHFQTSHLTPDVAANLAQSFMALVEHTVQFPAAQASDKRSIGTEIPQLFDKKQSQETRQVSLANAEPSRPWSYQEEALREILCKFSGVDSEAVHLHTTIFQLGLDSINAVQVSGKLRRLGYKISAGDILEV